MKTVFRCAVLLLVLSLPLVGEDPPGVYQAPDAEPTPEETLILEYINRCRREPMADALRMAPPEKKSDSIDYEMFRKEMSEFKPCGPLVFDLQILKAARWHSAYQIQHGQGHVQEAGKPGFSGVSFMDRMKAAGYSPTSGAENVFTEANNAWHSHEAFVIDWGMGPGGMQPDRGHRKNILTPDFTVAGIAAVPHDGRYSVTHNFSKAKDRMAGGVVYDDRNRNQFYDLGEGLGGVEISSGDKTVKSWKSGAYALAIPSGEVKLAVTLNQKKYAKKQPADTGTIKFDVILPPAAALEIAAKNYKNAAGIADTPANANRRTKALVNLYLGSQVWWVDEQTAEQIATLTQKTGEDLTAAQVAVRAALQGEDMAAAKMLVTTHRKTYLGTEAAVWFTEAASIVPLRERYLKWTATKAEGKPVTEKLLQPDLTTMAKTYGKLQIAEWQVFLKDLGTQTMELAK